MGKTAGSRSELAGIASAAHRVRCLWRPMAGWTLVVWLCGVFVLAPLTTWLISWKMRREEFPVVGNEDLAVWLFTVDGLLYLLLIGSLGLIGMVIRYAGYFRMITDDLHGRPVSLRRIFIGLLPLLPRLFRFCMLAVLLGWLAVLPLGGSLFLVYLLFLGEHDPNYYLYLKPPEWYQALWVAAGVFLVWALAMAWLAGRIVLALPYCLEGGIGLRQALKRSWASTRGRSRRLLKPLAILVLLWLATRVGVDALVLASGAAGVNLIAEHSPFLWPILLAAGLYLASAVTVDLGISFIGFSMIATLVTKYFYEDTLAGGDAVPVRRSARLGLRIVRGFRPWVQPSRLIPLALLLAGGSMLLSGRFFGGEPEMPEVVVSAHRGGPPPAPENTLAALELAIEAGADYSEIDVLRTGDGVLVLAHDADLMRVAGDPRRIAAHTYAEFADVVQLPDGGFPKSERRLVTLGDYMERARGRIGLMIELKYYGADPDLAPAVIREIRERAMEEQVVVMSLSLEAVEQVRRLAPDLTLGYVSTVSVGQLRRLPVDFLALPRGRVNSASMREARRRGVEVHAWTINRADRMAAMIELGVSGIITDDPERAVQVREEIGRMTALERFLLRFVAR